jgi:hypothetical protein
MVRPPGENISTRSDAKKEPSFLICKIVRARRIAPGASLLIRIEITKFDLLNVVATNMGLGMPSCG